MITRDFSPDRRVLI